jgi:hypothetical protein
VWDDPGRGNALWQSAWIRSEDPCSAGEWRDGRVERGGAIECIEIIHLNFERYRRLPQTNLDESTRCATERLLVEFDAKLATQLASVPKRERISEYDDPRQSAPADE